MQLAGQTADVALLLEQLGDELFILGEFVVSVENGLVDLGKRPVIKQARLGVQMGDWVYARVRATPSSTRRSRFGVWI